MTNKDIIDYVQHTPHNINPIILKQKLKEQDEDIAGAQDAVQYVEQELTEEQKLQVRKNLDLYYVDSKITDIIPEQEVTFWIGKANFTNWIDPHESGIVENPGIVQVVLKFDDFLLKGELSYNDDGGIATFDLPMDMDMDGGTAIVDLNNGIIKGTPFDATEYTIHMYFEHKEVEKIPTECFDLDEATNQIKEELAPVSYKEQDLILTEQMQARKNLGLYGEYEDYIVLANLGPNTPGYPWQITAQLEETVIVEIWDVQPSKIRYKATLHRQGDHWYIPGLGDHNYQYHWGNASLIKYDEEVSYAENDTGEPIVLYVYALGVEGTDTWESGCKLLIDPNFLPEHYIGFEVIIKSSHTSTITNIVPEEYLPDKIQKSVTYNEQYLNEEEQMQTRKNLGLYYKMVEPALDFSLDMAGNGANQVINLGEPIYSPNFSGSYIFDLTSPEIHGKYNRMDFYSSDLDIQYCGNGALLIHDNEISESGLSGNDTGEEFVFYRKNKYIDGEWVRSWHIIFSYASMYIGGNIYNGEDQYLQVHPIQGEWLPKARAVPDISGETVTAEQFNMLLQALRDAGYLNY